MKHMGNLTVTADNAATFPPISEFFGHLTIAAGAHLVAPNLQMIRGWLTIEGGSPERGETDLTLDGGHLSAEHLGLVDGWMNVGYGSYVQTPNLAKVTRTMTMGGYGGNMWLALEEVGTLTVSATPYGQTVIMNNLTRINDSLAVGNKARAELRGLFSIGGSITLRGKSELMAPNLEHIGGFYDADETAKLVAPAFLAS